MNGKASSIKRLADSSEGMEIWWDSSPLIYQTWSQQMIEKSDFEDPQVLQQQLEELFDYKDPDHMVFSGVTTNPRLTSNVIKLVPQEVEPIVDRLIRENPARSDDEIAWEAYKAITEKGARLYLPLFEKSGYKKGYVSAQVDPRLVTNTREMLRQALELKKLGENIMIKCPGSKEGIYVIQILTSLGIPTNSTLVFNVPQAVAVAQAVKKGREIGMENGIDYSKWRSVITIMLARFEDREQYAQSAQAAGIEMTEELKRWTGIAIAKKAHALLNDPKNGYASKLLLCSTRVGPGQDHVFHIEKLAGANLVFTINPEMIDDFMRIAKDRELRCSIEEPVPQDIMDKLLKIPYFVQGYEVDGIAKEDFVHHPSFVYTANEFSGSMKFIADYVTERRSLM